MKTGKIPHDLLRRLLSSISIEDRRVVVGPAPGEDAAAVAVGGRLVVASIDPITFASDLIGWYAVQVNANDVAVMGAQPAWFLAAVLLPEDAAPALAEDIFGQMLAACRELNIALIGGHTEVTHGLERPLVVGTMLAETERIIESKGAREGDCLILTKGVAVEGTALLAREAEEKLRAAGIGEETVSRARELLFEPGISVVREALLAAGTGVVHAMHDPTEGGLATAVHELAEAAGLGAEVRGDDIRVLPETAAVCGALGLDPMGLLASGALLIAVAPEDCERIAGALRASKTDAVCIGSLVSRGQGVIMNTNGRVGPLPRFDRDELARFLTGG